MFLSRFRNIKLSYFTNFLTKRFSLDIKPLSEKTRTRKGPATGQTSSKENKSNEEKIIPKNQMEIELKNLIIHREILREEFSVFETKNLIKKPLLSYEKFLQVFNESFSISNVSNLEKMNLKFQDLCKKLNLLSEELRMMPIEINETKTKMNDNIINALNHVLYILLKERVVYYQNGEIKINMYSDSSMKIVAIQDVKIIFEYIDLSSLSSVQKKRFFSLFNLYSQFMNFSQMIFEKYESFIEEKLKDIDFEDSSLSNVFLTCLLRNKKHFPKFSQIFFNHKDVFLKGKSYNEMAVLFNEVFSKSTESLKNISVNDLNSLFTIFLEEISNKKVISTEQTNLILFYLYLLKIIKSNSVNFNILSSLKNNFINMLIDDILNLKLNYSNPNNINVIIELSNFIPKEKTSEYIRLIKEIIKSQSNNDFVIKTIDYYGYNYNSNFKRYVK
jgi:hypothetical protein